MKQWFFICAASFSLFACSPSSPSVPFVESDSKSDPTTVLQAPAINLPEIPDTESTPIAQSTETHLTAPEPIAIIEPQAMPKQNHPTGEPVAKPAPGTSRTDSLAFLTLAPGQVSLAKTGDSARLIIIARDVNGQYIAPESLELTWHSSDPSLFSVNEQGQVTALNHSGHAQIKVEANGVQATASAVMVGSSAAEQSNVINIRGGYN